MLLTNFKSYKWYQIAESVKKTPSQVFDGILNVILQICRVAVEYGAKSAGPKQISFIWEILTSCNDLKISVVVDKTKLKLQPI